MLNQLLLFPMHHEYFTGPDQWAKDFPIADGPRQSPINIVPMEAPYDPSLKALKLNYDQSNAKGILNNGHSFQMDFVDDTDSSSKGHKWHYYMSDCRILAISQNQNKWFITC